MDNDVGMGKINLKAGEDRSAYGASFGPLANNTTYFKPPALKSWAGTEQDVINSTDLRPELNSACESGMAQMKALNVSGQGAGTAGYALIPVYVDPRIVDRSRKFTPWTELISRVTNQGVTADYNVLTAKGAAVFAAEDAALSDVTDTESRANHTNQVYVFCWKNHRTSPSSNAWVHCSRTSANRRWCRKRKLWKSKRTKRKTVRGSC